MKHQLQYDGRLFLKPSTPPHPHVNLNIAPFRLWTVLILLLRVKEYYWKLFTVEQITNAEELLPGIRRVITEDLTVQLEEVIEPDEIVR